MTSMHARAAIAALTLAGALAATGSAAANSLPSTVKCGDTLTHSVKLTADLTDCPADGLVIGAAGITVDLNGHTIDGTVTQATDCDVPPFGVVGISAGGYDGLTIKNGTIQQFTGGVNGGSDTDGTANTRLVPQLSAPGAPAAAVSRTVQPVARARLFELLLSLLTRLGA
jgi:hypothetical protein